MGSPRSGRPRKPSIVKFNAGERRKERLNPDEPKPDLCIPPAPKHLRGIALEEWNRITVQLDKLSLLTECDMTALSCYCSAWARHTRAERKIDKLGEVIVTSNGNEIQSPWVGISNMAMQMMHKFLTEFGLSPASRTRVQTKKPDEKKTRWTAIG